MLDFLTPEIFDMLVIANLIVALVLIAFRFYQDMTRKVQPDAQREQAYDEASYDHLNDTDQASSPSETSDNTQQQNMLNS